MNTNDGRSWLRRRGLVAVVSLAATLAMLAARPTPAAAHPLGNFTVNQYSRLELTVDGSRLVYVLDLAELPTFQERSRVDQDGDGIISDRERETYADAKLAEILPSLHLIVADRAVSLQPISHELSFLDGQAGLPTTRLRAVFAVDAPVVTPDAAPTLVFRNDYANDRIGWRELVVTHGPGIRLDTSDAPVTDRTNELRVYPQDLLSTPLDQRTATVVYRRDAGAAAAAGYVATDGAGDEPNARPMVGRLGGLNDRFAALLDGGDLTAPGIAFALLAAMVWGALHALSPGHGKTVVGAYLVGVRGTARHALFLGLTVTITHTAGVIALGLVTLFASRYVVPEQLFPWLSLGSGLLVVGMGVAILRQRVLGLPAIGHHHHHHDAHDHDYEHHDHAHHDHGHIHHHGGHTHSHLPPGTDGTSVTWRGLLALGVSGGLLPCPSALIALLGAIALGRAGFGLVLVLAFSVGLAGTLTGVGLLFLSAGRFLERRAPAGRLTSAVLRLAPVGGALGVTVAGLAIVVRALAETRAL